MKMALFNEMISLNWAWEWRRSSLSKYSTMQGLLEEQLFRTTYHKKGSPNLDDFQKYLRQNTILCLSQIKIFKNWTWDY